MRGYLQLKFESMDNIDRMDRRFAASIQPVQCFTDSVVRDFD